MSAGDSHNENELRGPAILTEKCACIVLSG